MNRSIAVKILCDIPLTFGTEDPYYEAIADAWLHAEPDSEVAKAIEFLGGLSASADALENNKLLN